ncbi:MAG: 4-hydroxy-2-oxovalerate aldolase, partial [Synergistaceae bacterium]|nr:4-hydroxy-2-oxovalerate aldolase [Synergistaceae bacterium]
MMKMKNLMKSRIQRGERVVGTFFELGGTTAVECLGLTGLDFFIIDTEHGPFDVESAIEFVRAAGAYSITPLVRVKDATRPSVLKMLDVGAQGLIVPNIHTADEVRQLVEYGKYYPKGRRGFAATRVVDFGFNPGMADIEA